jgi:hypothetical protein
VPFPSGMRRRGALALGAVLLAVVVLVAVVAVVRRTSRDTPTVDASAVSRNAARLDDLQRRITGTVAERVASERISYHRLHEPLRACIAAIGLPYFPQPFVNPYAGMHDADLTIGFAGNGWFAPISTQDFGIAAAQLRLSGAQSGDDQASAGYRSLSDADKDRYQEAQDSCAAPASTEDDVPTGEGELSAALDDVMAAVEARLPVKDQVAGYRGCMAAAGLPDLPDPAALADRLGRDFPPRDAMPLNGRPAAPEWDAVVAREHAAAQADARCRRGTYEQAVLAIGPELERFERDRAEALAAVRRGWAEVVAAAARLD